MKSRFRAAWTVACLATCGVGALGLAAAVAQAPAPAAEPAAEVLPGQLAVVPEPVWDAGVVGRGQTVTHAFEIRNVGSSTLYLREVRPACGCTVASFDEQIAPGQSGKVTAEVSTEEFRGPIAKDITVLTSDPSNPQLTLTVKAEVQPWVDAQPGYLRFIHVAGGAPMTSTQVLWSADQADFRVLGAESPLPQLEVTFRPATEQERDPGGKGRQWVVVGTLRGDAKPGPLAGDVVVRTSHPQQPTLALPIAGYVRPVLSVSPPEADFGSFAGGEPRRGSVIVTNNGEAPIRVLAADTDVPGLSAQVAQREAGKKYDVNLTLATGAARGPIRGTLRIRTDAPGHPLLEVPVLGEVR